LHNIAVVEEYQGVLLKQKLGNKTKVDELQHPINGAVMRENSYSPLQCSFVLQLDGERKVGPSKAIKTHN